MDIMDYDANYAAVMPSYAPPLPTQPPAPIAIVDQVNEAEAILKEFRRKLKMRTANPDGSSGIQGLARNFRICDSNKNGTLDLNEFAKCIALCKLNLTPEEIGKLFAHFDAGGSIDYEEFLHAARGPLSAARKKVVMQAFHALDNRGNGDGVLRIANVRGLYDVSMHPDVLSGRLDAGSALRQFLDAFEGSQGNHDGIITADEWIKYYEEVSASIDGDDYFCQLVANTWGSLNGKNNKKAVTFVAKKDVDAVEKLLFDSTYRRKGGSVHSQERLVNDAFKLFDKDGSGCVSKVEFVQALERFGVHIRGKGRMGIGGLPEAVVHALFDRYDVDGSGTLSFREFSTAFIGRHQEKDTGIPADEYNKKAAPTDPEDDWALRHPKKKHEHEIMAARQPQGMSRPGYAGYLSQAAKIHGTSKGKSQGSGAPFLPAGASKYSSK